MSNQHRKEERKLGDLLDGFQMAPRVVMTWFGFQVPYSDDLGLSTIHFFSSSNQQTGKFGQGM